LRSARFSEALTLGYGNKVIPEGARIVQVDIDRREIGKIYPARHAVVGDAKTVLRELINRLKRGRGKIRAAEARGREALLREKLEARE
jgi:thiamine pyrophosphate-dependent acetolactate synthase large subunit-like protein